MHLKITVTLVVEMLQPRFGERVSHGYTCLCINQINSHCIMIQTRLPDVLFVNKGGHVFEFMHVKERERERGTKERRIDRQREREER